MAIPPTSCLHAGRVEPWTYSAPDAEPAVDHARPEHEGQVVGIAGNDLPAERFTVDLDADGKLNGDIESGCWQMIRRFGLDGDTPFDVAGADHTVAGFPRRPAPVLVRCAAAVRDCAARRRVAVMMVATVGVTRGPRGFTGAKGDTGSTGPAANRCSRAVSTGAVGSTATVTNPGTPYFATLDSLFPVVTLEPLGTPVRQDQVFVGAAVDHGRQRRVHGRGSRLPQPHRLRLQGR